MTKIKYLIAVILTICIAATPGYVVSADNIQNYKTNIEENSLEDVVYHIDAVTHEITVQTLKEKTANSKRSNTEANVGEHIPEHLLSEQQETITPRYLLGSWSKITNTKASRYRNTVFIRIQTDNGKIYGGTGVFIGPNAILTAAHVVNNSKFGDDRIPNSATVFPGYSYQTEGTTPYGSATVRSYIVPSNWTNNNNSNYDWAIITLNSNLGDSVGNYGFKWKSGNYNGTSIYAHGYPGKLSEDADAVGGNEFLYMTSGTICTSLEYTLRSSNTNAIDGMSGGPLYIYSATYGYQSIGIVSGGIKVDGVKYNRFTRITETLYDLLVEYNTFRV